MTLAPEFMQSSHLPDPTAACSPDITIACILSRTCLGTLRIKICRLRAAAVASVVSAANKQTCPGRAHQVCLWLVHAFDELNKCRNHHATATYASMRLTAERCHGQAVQFTGESLLHLMKNTTNPLAFAPRLHKVDMIIQWKAADSSSSRMFQLN